MLHKLSVENSYNSSPAVHPTLQQYFSTVEGKYGRCLSNSPTPNTPLPPTQQVPVSSLSGSSTDDSDTPIAWHFFPWDFDFMCLVRFPWKKSTLSFQFIHNCAPVKFQFISTFVQTAIIHTVTDRASSHRLWPHLLPGQRHKYKHVILRNVIFFTHLWF